MGPSVSASSVSLLLIRNYLVLSRTHNLSGFNGLSPIPGRDLNDPHPSSPKNTLSCHQDWLRDDPVTQAGPMGAFPGPFRLKFLGNRCSLSTGVQNQPGDATAISTITWGGLALRVSQHQARGAERWGAMISNNLL